jgi:hypothetical protein
MTAQFFAFITLIAMGLIVIAFLNRPAGTKQLGTSFFGGFQGLLGELSNTQQTGTPGQY